MSIADGRHVARCLDCGHAHGELEACAECDCSGAIDSQSTLYCPRCLNPIPHVSPAQISMGRGEHECPKTRTD